MADPQPLLKTLFSPRNVKLLAFAFGFGLLIFLFLWLDQRNDTDFFKASESDTATGEDAGLPAPLPADVAGDEQNASGLRLPPAEQAPGFPAEEQPRIIEPMAPVAEAETPREYPSPDMAEMPGGSTSPVPISRPPPIYPREALRRGVGGTVRVQVTVAPDGRVERMDVAQSSGDRYLDRAAMEAVRRWRFSPALRNGRPVSATVFIPVDFAPNR
ncbi:MAG: energy transducer TonB [Pseudomonadota bacterium]|nr:energy transducer TonB [Pseudomonadota bacterium]